MNYVQDAEYFKRRELAERDLAALSGEPQIARLHLEMAEEYARKAAAVVPRATLGVVHRA